MKTGQALHDFANSFYNGYLKMWKANAIIMTLTAIPEILLDNDRAFNYLESVLGMEGFNDSDILEVRDFLQGLI